MRKIVRVLGKRGRITIPYEIRIRNNIGYNDILSFEEKDANTIILKKEKLCGGCTPECFDEVDDLSIEDFLDSLTPEQQRKATIHLNLLWAQREGAKIMSNTNDLTVKTGTIVRTICLFLALINQLLSNAGHAVLPIENEQVETIVTTGIMIGVALWNWWKNNSFTKKAIAADKYMETLK